MTNSYRLLYNHHVFRDDTPRCLSCDAALEHLGDRYVCNCGAVLIAAAHLGALLDELSPDDKRPIESRLFTKGIPGQTCPRCTTTMATGWVHDVGLERCATHGVWFTKGTLAQLLQQHADLYNQRENEQSKLMFLAAIPLVNAIAVPIGVLLAPWAKRRRLRKYLAVTTPKPKP